MFFSDAAQVTPIHFVSAARSDGRRLTLGDVADLSRLPPPLRRAADGLVVAVAPAGRRRLVLSASLLRQRLRGQIPALAPWLVEDGPADGREASILVDFTAPPPAVTVARSCVVIQRSVPEGAALTAADVQPIACAVPPRNLIRYDSRIRAVRALMDLQAGDEVAAPPPSSLATLQAGRTITIAARFGPVKVERQVQSLQPVFQGRGTFARAEDGRIFAVSAEEIETGDIEP